MSIFFCPYSLRSRGSLNAVSQRREFHGALIKVDDGFGCLHPWPEFGDAPIDEQLKILREGGTSEVIERALCMAAVDGAARRRGVSLFQGLEIPPSHFSLDQNQSLELQIQRIICEGWQAIKTKGSSELKKTIAVLEAISKPAGNAPLKLRVDFNSCLTASQFADFMHSLSPDVRGRIDFIEDPFPYDGAAWFTAQNELGVRLACDKGLKRPRASAIDDCCYGIAVLKPGRRDWRSALAAIPANARIVMTSAMDHAIGQSFAAWEAAMAWREHGSRMELCGLCTEYLFEKDAFFERLSSHGGMLKMDTAGTGLGFDDVLAELKWEKL